MLNKNVLNLIQCQLTIVSLLTPDSSCTRMASREHQTELISHLTWFQVSLESHIHLDLFWSDLWFASFSLLNLSKFTTVSLSTHFWLIFCDNFKSLYHLHSPSAHLSFKITINRSSSQMNLDSKLIHLKFTLTFF